MIFTSKSLFALSFLRIYLRSHAFIMKMVLGTLAYIILKEIVLICTKPLTRFLCVLKWHFVEIFREKDWKKFKLSAKKFHVSKKSKRLHNFDAEDVTSLLIACNYKKIKPQCLQMSQISCVHLMEILHIVFFGTSIFLGTIFNLM